MPTAKKKTTPRPARDESADLERFDFQEDSLGYALRRAQVHAYDLFFEMLGELELSPARLTALSIIAIEPDMNQATLARRLNVSGPSVMKLIDALEAAGHIRRMDVEGDRRAYLVRLTPQGREQFNTMARQHEQWIVEAFATLGERDIATLYRLLGKVKEHTQNNSLETTE